MSDILTEQKTRKARITTQASIEEQIARQPLEVKVALHKFITTSIQGEKKKLEDQLALIK